jgi:hypothetical protein
VPLFFQWAARGNVHRTAGFVSQRMSDVRSELYKNAGDFPFRPFACNSSCNRIITG